MRTTTPRRWVIGALALILGLLTPMAGSLASPATDAGRAGRTIMCLGLTATEVGTAAAETINGTAGADVIVGLGGNDRITGGGGNDRICGNDGDDTISAGRGNDQVQGGPGRDTILGGLGADILRGGTGPDRITGSPGNDKLFGEPGNDTLDGDLGTDTTVGGLGTDECSGESKVSCEAVSPPASTHPLVAATCSTPDICAHPLVGAARWDVPVLSIAFLPDANRDGVIDFDATDWRGSVAELRGRIQGLNNAGAWWMTEATRYRGEGSTPRDPSLGFRIVDQIEYQTSVPRGLPIPWNPGWYRPDYMEILTGIDVCRWVDGLGVREIWMWTQHHAGIEPVESNLSSTFGDISNSERTDDLPVCGHSYTLYNFNFTRSEAMMLHNRMHQAEALFGWADPTLWWDLFVGNTGPIYDPAALHRCGNGHYPPNGESDYDYWNPRDVLSDCLDWRPEGGIPQTVNCATWFGHVYGSDNCFNDEGLAFSVWWFQAIPGWNNSLTHNGRTLVDWWQLFADLEGAANGHGSWLTG